MVNIIAPRLAPKRNRKSHCHPSKVEKRFISSEMTTKLCSGSSIMFWEPCNRNFSFTTNPNEREKRMPTALSMQSSGKKISVEGNLAFTSCVCIRTGERRETGSPSFQVRHVKIPKFQGFNFNYLKILDMKVH